MAGDKILDIIILVMADWSLLPIVLLGFWTLLFKVPTGYKIKAYSFVLMAGLSAYLVAKIVASLYQPSELRPFELLGVDAKSSYLGNAGFPSDHTLLGASLALAVWAVTRRKAVSIVLASLVIIMATGRVLALVHSVADVVGAVAFALLGGLWYLAYKADYLKNSK